MALSPATQALVNDGKKLALDALGAVHTAIDSLFGEVAAAVPKLDDDALAAVIDVIEVNAPASVRGIISLVLGLVSTGSAAQLAALDARIIAALTLAQANVKLAMDKLDADLA